MIDFEEEVEEPKGPTQEQLSLISRLAKEQEDLERRIQEQEEVLKELKDKHRDVAQKQLPEAMEEAGVVDFTTDDGTRIEVQEKLYCSVPKRNKEWVRKWLENEGHDALIQYNVKALLQKGQKDKAEQAVKALREAGMDAVEEVDFHTGQLKSLLNEYLSSGENVALENFGAYLQRAANVKKKE